MEKVAVVTGSAKGLGRAIAIALSKQGYTLVICYNKSRQEAIKVLDEVKLKSGRSIAVPADLKDEAQVGRMFKEIFKSFRRIDLLVNNVGNFLYKKFSETTAEEFRNIIESNLYSSFYCCRAVLPVMRKQKSGQIINIGAVGAERVNLLEKSTPYFFAKTGVYLLTKIMAFEEARYAIRINMVSPGSLSTDIFKDSDFPTGRSATYEDVVKVLVFLISPDAYYINGGNIEVAGGFIPGLGKSK